MHRTYLTGTIRSDFGQQLVHPHISALHHRGIRWGGWGGGGELLCVVEGEHRVHLRERLQCLVRDILNIFNAANNALNNSFTTYKLYLEFEGLSSSAPFVCHHEEPAVAVHHAISERVGREACEHNGMHRANASTCQHHHRRPYLLMDIVIL